jgi:hypothetical protein
MCENSERDVWIRLIRSGSLLEKRDKIVPDKKNNTRIRKNVSSKYLEYQEIKLIPEDFE